ncbi:MAG: cysteine-rich KTR domain-containing protein [Coprobacillaceae bacterium]
MCPSCNSKTRVKVNIDTVMINFPLFCPKCKKETIIDIKNLNMVIIKEPVSKLPSR